MHLKPHNIGILLAAAVTLVALAACGSSPTATQSPTPTVTAFPTPTATAVPTVQAPAPTPAPSPTSAPTATATAAPISTPVPSSLADETFAFVEQLTLEYSPRESATDAELAAAQFLKSRFEDLGYETHLQEFTVGPLPRSELTITSDSESEDTWSYPMGKSHEGNASGVLRFVGMAFEEDIPADGLEGLVALIERGEITFEEKVQRVAEAGAVGAVVFNNRPGRFYGDLRNQSKIPTVSISRGDGQDLLDLIEQGEVEAQVIVKYVTLPSRNVIAEMPESTDTGKTVVVGAHYDTVPDSPGANDNASGIATIMTIARQAAGNSYPFSVRFVLFGSEEIGLFGSRHYVDTLGPEEISDTVAMLNFDSVGSGSRFGLLGDAQLTREVMRLGEQFGPNLIRPTTLPPNVSSDHAPFQDAGIPAMFLMSDDFTRIHTPEDKLQWVEPNLLGWSAEIGIGLLDWLSSSETP